MATFLQSLPNLFDNFSDSMLDRFIGCYLFRTVYNCNLQFMTPAFRDPVKKRIPIQPIGFPTSPLEEITFVGSFVKPFRNGKKYDRSLSGNGVWSLTTNIDISERIDKPLPALSEEGCDRGESAQSFPFGKGETVHGRNIFP